MDADLQQLVVRGYRLDTVHYCPRAGLLDVMMNDTYVNNYFIIQRVEYGDEKKNCLYFDETSSGN